MDNSEIIQVLTDIDLHLRKLSIENDDMRYSFDFQVGGFVDEEVQKCSQSSNMDPLSLVSKMAFCSERLIEMFNSRKDSLQPLPFAIGEKVVCINDHHYSMPMSLGQTPRYGDILTVNQARWSILGDWCTLTFKEMPVSHEGFCHTRFISYNAFISKRYQLN